VKAFIVHAHPEPTSYTAVLFETAQAALREGGHVVRTSDLYAMGFNPVAGRHDFAAPAESGALHYQKEQHHAAETKTFAADLAAEQEKLAWADLVVFQFPLWWFGLPGILKGWFDRVLAYGWAYGRRERFDSGGLRGRRALLAISIGAPEARYQEGAIFGSLDRVLYPIQVGILNYVGMEVLPPFLAWGVPRVDDETRAAYLARYRERLLGIERETPLPFHSAAQFPDPLGQTSLDPNALKRG
jgi:NAD(P)H dehydrogenase (quinone)